MRTASRTAWPIIAAIFTLAACNGSKSSAATTTANATSTPTAAVSSTTTVAASTTATPTQTTVAPVTTVAVTSTSTTLAPDVEVKTQYLKLTEGYWACLRAPKVCDAETLTASTGPARGALTKTVADLVSGDLFVGNDDPGYTAVEAVKVTDSTALVTSCWWDTGVIYGPPVEAGGAPIVVNNKQATARFETTMAFEGGRWLTSEAKRVARVEGVNQCPPKV